MSIDGRPITVPVQVVGAVPRRPAVPLAVAAPLSLLLSAAVGMLSLGVAPHGSLVGGLIVDDPAGWAVVGIVLVALSGQHRTVPSAVLGLISFVGLDLGWYLTGGGALSGSAIFWYAVAVVAGPLVGIATGWCRSSATRAAIGGGTLAGLLLGDAVAILRLLGNVPEAAGFVVAVLGALMLLLALARSRTVGDRLVVLGVTVATGLLYTAAWGAIMLVL